MVQPPQQPQSSRPEQEPQPTRAQQRSEEPVVERAEEPEQAYRRPEWVAHVLDDDRAVLLHLPSARRVVLSPEATAVWQEIVAAGEAGVRAGDITAALAPRYAAEPTTIDADVRNLLVELLDAGLVEAVDPAAQGVENVEGELPADAAEAEQA